MVAVSTASSDGVVLDEPTGPPGHRRLVLRGDGAGRRVAAARGPPEVKHQSEYEQKAGNRGLVRSPQSGWFVDESFVEGDRDANPA